MKKIIALLLIVLSVAFCFVSCGEPEEEKPEGSTETDIPGLPDAGFEGPLVPIEPD